MNTLDAINISSRMVYLILVPILRELAGALLAIAISKDCKARNNGSSALWGLFTLITPVFAGIIYFIYSRILEKRKPQTDKDKKKVKSSRRLTIWAFIVYGFAIIFAIISIISTSASTIAEIITGEGQVINSYIHFL